MSELINEEACRKKAAEKIEEITARISRLSDSEKFKELRKEFDGRASAIKLCLDNFRPEEFISRGHTEASGKFLSRIMQSAVQGYYTLRGISGLMEETSLSRINGTAVDFLDRQDKLMDLNGVVETRREFFNSEMQRRLNIGN